VPFSSMTKAETGQQSASPTAGMAQVRRRRARAAIVMIVASLSIGFLLGRGSTWVVPLGTTAVSVADRQPAIRTSTGAGSSAVVSRALSPDIGAVEPNSSKAGGDPLEASATGFGVLVWASRPTAMRESTERTEPNVAILNRGGADTGRDGNDEVSARSEIVDSVASAEYWLKRAEKARRQAADMTHRAAKREMLNIAEAYRRLAQYAKDEAVDREPRRRRR
jgi:hypothetical protein